MKLDQDISENLLKIIDKNEQYILYDYKGDESQILIKSELISQLSTYIKNKLQDDPKKILKPFFREEFELSPKDIIIFKDGFVFIKIVDEAFCKTVPENQKNTKANRYNGIAEEELESFYKDFFAEEENRYFIKDVANYFTQKYFVEKRIDNATYEANVFKYIQRCVFKLLNDDYEEDEDGFLFGFAGYVFRKHFKEVFEYIADFILNEISESNNYMIEFLNYYSLDVVVLNGQKYKVPSITSPNGLRWKVVSMLSIAKIYTKTKKLHRMLQKNILQLNSKVKEFYVNGHSPLYSKQHYTKLIINIEQKLKAMQHKLNVYQDNYDATKDENTKNNIKFAIKLLQEDIDVLENEKKSYEQKLPSQDIINKYTKLQKQLDALSRDLSKQNAVLEKNKDSYINIREALIKALISKKQPI